MAYMKKVERLQARIDRKIRKAVRKDKHFVKVEPRWLHKDDCEILSLLMEVRYSEYGFCIKRFEPKNTVVYIIEWNEPIII